MRRRILMTALVGVLAAGFGCRHVGGKCDCGANPADAVIHPPTPPYPTAPAPGLVPGNPAPAPAPRVETKTPDRLPIPMPPKN